MRKRNSNNRLLLFSSLLLSAFILISFFYYKNESIHKNYDLLKKYTLHKNALDSMMANYYISRIEIIYLSSASSPRELKDKSLRLIPSELEKFQETKLKYQNTEMDQNEYNLFQTMINDFEIVKLDIESAFKIANNNYVLSRNDKTKVDHLVFDNIPIHRNAFRVSAEKLFSYTNQQITDLQRKIDRDLIQNKLAFILLAANLILLGFLLFKLV